MNVSFVLASLSRNAGGLFDIGRRLAQELHRTPETRVGVVGLRDEYTEADAPRWAPLALAPCERVGPKILGWAPSYQQALQSQHPDVVHQHGIWTLGSFEASRFSRQAQVPLVVSVHGMIDPWALKHSKWKKRIAWTGYQSDNLNRAGCIFVNSQTEAAYVRDTGVKTPLAVVPNGVDPLAGTESSPAWEEAIGRERRVLLFLGRIHPKKGVFELVRAWAQFVARYPDRARNWSLVVTGWDDGGHEANLRALARELGLTAPSFHMTGPLFGERRDAALSNAHGFVLPSHSEGMPMSALEALSAGVPQLLTDACNLPQVIEKGAGFRIAPSAEGICDGIVQLVALPKEAHDAMSARARQLASDVFSWPNAARDTRRVYAWLLGSGPRPSDLLTD